MARIVLDLGNFTDDNGNVDLKVIERLAADLDVTVTPAHDLSGVGDLRGFSEPFLFTGDRFHLIVVITRFEEDTDLAVELVEEIRD